MKNSFEFLTGKENPYLESFEDSFIHRDIISPLLKLKELAKVEIGADIKVISGHRDYVRQEIIWNAKISGERKVLDDNGNEVDLANLTDIEILNAIMRFSAIPGASRHHWGCDIDIYDASKCEKSQVQLTPNESSIGGVFYELHSWLTKKIKDGQSFGFYRPYETDQGAVHPEAWHISHSPTSTSIHHDYTQEVFKANIEQSNMLLKSEILNNPSIFYQKYLQRIDKA
jgi:LAS superfamily LD-carboxypeptidase LdcB